jgi:hypothetical protein
MRFVALLLNRWDAIEALTPAPLPVAPVGESIGFMLVYDTVAALRRAHPHCDYAAIEESKLVKGGEQGHTWHDHAKQHNPKSNLTCPQWKGRA